MQIAFGLRVIDNKAVLPKSVPVILNCRAGTGHSDPEADKLRQAFEQAGLEARVVSCQHGEGLQDAVRKTLKDKPEVLVAAGGDGTISAVADAVRGSGTALGVMPLGTLNHFAKDLGIPPDPVEAARTIAGGRRIAVDMGEVNGRGFINNASLGVYPGMVQERDRQQRRLRRSKRHAMLWATLAVLNRPPLLDLHLDLGGEVHECRAPFVFVGNNAYHMEGFNIGTRERLDGGVLDVYTTRRRHTGGLLLLALRALLGRLRQADDFIDSTARTLRVASRRPSLLVATDGEVTRMPTPLEFRILPRALDVIVP